MLFLEFASVGPMLGQADISTLAQRRTNGWITIGMFTGMVLGGVLSNPSIQNIISLQNIFLKVCYIFMAV